MAHAKRKHALLSASGSARWMNCTPSARLEEQFPSHTTGYADEGTLAHEIAEVQLLYALKQISMDEFIAKTEKLFAHKLYSDEMFEYVQEYVDYVLEVYNDYDDAHISVEEKIDLTEYIEEGFGSNDSSVVGGNTLHVIDLKYGKGVRVEAEENSQLMLYGLGSLLIHSLSYDIEVVRLTIVQPRLDSISSWDISVKDLLAWGDKQVKPKAKLAYAGEGELSPGDHCRWCKAKAKCPALHELATTTAQKEFSDTLSDDKVLEAYHKLDLVSMWINAVREYVMSEALKGKKWPGLKLVAGRSQRKIIDKEKVAEILLAEGFESEQIYTTSLKGITALEKVVGKVQFGALLSDQIEKPIGKPTLAPETDKRPEFNITSAIEDFND